MTALSKLSHLADAALSTARRPLEHAGFAAGLVKGAVSGGVRLVDTAVRGVTGHLPGHLPGQRSAHESGAASAGEPTATGAGLVTTHRTAKRADPVTIVEPVPPTEPPVQIVEQVLEAERTGAPDRFVGGGHATEPHAVTREETHGQAGLGRIERDEIEDEKSEALEG